MMYSTVDSLITRINDIERGGGKWPTGAQIIIERSVELSVGGWVKFRFPRFSLVSFHITYGTVLTS